MRVDDDATATLSGRNSVATRAEVKDLLHLLVTPKAWNVRRAYLNVRKIITLHSGNTTALIKANLPHPRKVCQKVTNAFSIAYVPHLERTIRARDNLLTVVLKAGDCTGVRTKRRLASTALGVPDAESTICRCGDQAIMAEIKQADE